MTDGPEYVLDANVFIEAAKGYYAFDIAPRFWEALIENARNGKIVSVDRVKDEIDRGNDSLTDWANQDFSSWFDRTDTPDVINAYQQVMSWASQQTQYHDAAIAEFARLTNADAWVISKALSAEITVVTHEQFNPATKRKIPVPNACRAFDIEYIDTFELLRNLGIRLG